MPDFAFGVYYVLLLCRIHNNSFNGVRNWVLNQVTIAINGQNNIYGIIYVLIGIFMLSIMDAVAKWLVGADYPVEQILALRGSMTLAFMLLWAHFSGGIRNRLATNRFKDHAFRGVLGYAAPFCFFSALKTLPLADATIIFFAAPFIMTALSVPLFKESVNLQRWLAVIIGVIGVLIVIQPGASSFQPMSLLAFAGCVSYSLASLQSRWLGTTESTFAIVFYFNLMITLISILFVPFSWVPINMTDLGIVGIMAILGFAGHIYMTRAFNTGQIAVIVPFEYSALIWSVLLGYLFWNELPEKHVWLGAAIIIAGGLYIIHREKPRQLNVHPDT